MTEIEHEYTNNIICPYCGYEDRDSWDVNGDEGDVTCGECERSFLFSRHVEVSYSTKRCDCLNGDKPHKWKSLEVDLGGKTVFKHYYRCKTCETRKTFDGETREEFESMEVIG